LGDQQLAVDVDQRGFTDAAAVDLPERLAGHFVEAVNVGGVVLDVEAVAEQCAGREASLDAVVFPEHFRLAAAALEADDAAARGAVEVVEVEGGVDARAVDDDRGIEAALGDELA